MTQSVANLVAVLGTLLIGGTLIIAMKLIGAGEDSGTINLIIGMCTMVLTNLFIIIRSNANKDAVIAKVNQTTLAVEKNTEVTVNKSNTVVKAVEEVKQIAATAAKEVVTAVAEAPKSIQAEVVIKGEKP